LMMSLPSRVVTLLISLTDSAEMRALPMHYIGSARECKKNVDGRWNGV
jgi:hypothetical protein